MAMAQEQFDAEQICAAIEWLKRYESPTLCELHQFLGHSELSNTKSFLSYLQSVGVRFHQCPTMMHLQPSDPIPVDGFEWLESSAVSTKLQQIVADPVAWRLGGKAVSAFGEVFDSVAARPWVDSTQRWAQQAATDTPFQQHFFPRAFMTDYQSQGRGRRHRQWHARMGECLMMTVSLSVPREALDQRLSPAFAILLCDWLNQRYGLPAQVKWPNDLLFDGRKLAGFLVQSTPMRSATSAIGTGDALCLMMGLGLNLSLDEMSQAQIGQPALGIRDTGYAFPDKATLAAEVLLVFARLFEAMRTQDWQFLADLWPRYDAYHHQPVRLLISEHEQIEGTNIGIDTDGQLLLQTPNGQVQSFCVGEVSLRRPSTDLSNR